MLGLTIGLLAALASAPAGQTSEPSPHLRQLAKTCQQRRGIAAKAFVRHLGRAKRGRTGWSVVLQGKDPRAREGLAKKIAKAAGAQLTRVDPKRLAGRGPAEAKKNLEALFASAREGNGVLLFDEADALFGQRTQVADAHDRYANLEVSHLLERVVVHSDLVLIGVTKSPDDQKATKALRDVVVAIPADEAEGGADLAVPWTSLCWPPR